MGKSEMTKKYYLDCSVSGFVTVSWSSYGMGGSAKVFVPLSKLHWPTINDLSYHIAKDMNVGFNMPEYLQFSLDPYNYESGTLPSDTPIYAGQKFQMSFPD